MIFRNLSTQQIAKRSYAEAFKGTFRNTPDEISVSVHFETDSDTFGEHGDTTSGEHSDTSPSSCESTISGPTFVSLVTVIILIFIVFFLTFS